MEADLAQIKLLLWVILGLQVVFVLSNIACRIFGCGADAAADYGDLLSRGEHDRILSYTKKRLASHPNDLDALYFRAKALQSIGLPASARPFVEHLGKLDPLLATAAEEWLATLDEQTKSGS